MEIFRFYFSLPYGNIWSNLLASAIVGIIGFGTMHIHLGRVNASVRERLQDPQGNADTIRKEKRGPDLLRDREQRQDQRTQIREQEMNINPSFKTGFWAACGVIVALLTLGLVLRAFD